MAGSLKGARAKVDRAQAQLGDLRTETQRVFPANKRWPVGTETDPSGLEYRFYLRGEPPTIDPRWGLIAGEIMFDLRAALDYLVFELHVRHFRGNVPRKVEGATQFPVYSQPIKFEKNLRRIENLSERDQVALRHLQPYIRRRDKWFLVRRWLSRLNAIHNVDKHRQLHLVAVSQNAAHFPKMDPALGFESDPVWGAVKADGQVDRWIFDNAPKNIKPHPGVVLQVTLEHEGEWVELVEFLKGSLVSVLQVIDRFADRFEG